jgi:two-component system response regulator RegA
VQSTLMQSILLVDDDAVLCDRLGRALRDRGYDVQTAANYEEALSGAKARPPTYLITDVNLPGRSGIDLAAAVGALAPATTILVLSGASERQLALAKQGGLAFLRKPADADEIVSALERARTSAR